MRLTSDAGICYPSPNQHESGVHRVQRVPVNDTRVHTSATTVAVLAEPEEVDLRLDPRDLKFDVSTLGARLHVGGLSIWSHSHDFCLCL